jgi:hypothetical protein
MSPETWLKLLRQHRAIAVIRTPDRETGYQLAQAVAAGGIRLIEITWNSSEPDRLILPIGATPLHHRHRHPADGSRFNRRYRCRSRVRLHAPHQSQPDRRCRRTADYPRGADAHRNCHRLASRRDLR